MSADVVAVLLPSERPDADVEGTIASIRAELGETASVRLLDDGGGSAELPAGVVRATAAELLGAGTVLAFARAGDRWRPATLEHRLRPLLAHPTAALVVAGHARVDADGQVVERVGAPTVPVDPLSLLVSERVAISAVLVRAAALDAEALELLDQPHGDAALLCRLTAAHGLLCSGEEAAEVVAPSLSAPDVRVAEAIRLLADPLDEASRLEQPTPLESAQLRISELAAEAAALGAQLSERDATIQRLRLEAEQRELVARMAEGAA